MKRIFWLVALMSLAGCASLCPMSWCAKARAVATLHSTSPDATVGGTVQFAETSHGLRITVHVEHAAPGMHGFHIHEGNSCDDMAKAAGGHYNPAGMRHGYLPKEGLLQVHAGDFGNIAVGKNGRGSRSFTMPGLTLVGGTYPVVGRAVVLHAKQDDLASQPAGNAGERIACGIIAAQGQ